MVVVYEDPPLFPRPPLFALLLTFGTHLTPGMPCDVAFSLQDGRTPLRAASAAGHIDCVKLLLDGGTQANHHDEVGTVQGWIQGIWTCVVIVWGRILLVVWRRIPMVELLHHHHPHLNHGPQWWSWSHSLHYGLHNGGAGLIASIMAYPNGGAGPIASIMAYPNGGAGPIALIMASPNGGTGPITSIMASPNGGAGPIATIMAVPNDGASQIRIFVLMTLLYVHLIDILFLNCRYYWMQLEMAEQMN